MMTRLVINYYYYYDFLQADAHSPIHSSVYTGPEHIALKKSEVPGNVSSAYTPIVLRQRFVIKF